MVVAALVLAELEELEVLEAEEGRLQEEVSEVLVEEMGDHLIAEAEEAELDLAELFLSRITLSLVLQIVQVP